MEKNETGILYHDTTKTPEYGTDHMLLNNWDPEKDYGNEYANVYFRINTNNFDSISGSFWDIDDRAAFTEEKTKVFHNLGWKTKSEEHCMTVGNGYENLYLHPQDFSGIVKKNEIRRIAEALQHNKTFSLRWVDVYDTVYDMSDFDYSIYLDSQSRKIKELIFEQSQTKRRNLFKMESDVANSVGMKVRKPRIRNKNPLGMLDKLTFDYVKKMIAEMITEGFLVAFTGDNGTRYVRSLNKTEMKKMGHGKENYYE